MPPKYPKPVKKALAAYKKLLKVQDKEFRRAQARYDKTEAARMKLWKRHENLLAITDSLGKTLVYLKVKHKTCAGESVRAIIASCNGTDTLPAEVIANLNPVTS